MKLYYNASIRTLDIEKGSKVTTLDIPEEFGQFELATILQSETIYSIIQQLLDNNE